jgi:hydroxymethylpyrimidine/phosphomethylpyrimidine kinase
MDVPNKDYPLAQPRAEQFDALVRELLPKVRLLSPHLSEVEALRAAARMAEYRLDDEATLIWGWR